MSRYIHEEQHYYDLYDLETINQSLEIIRKYREEFQKHRKSKEYEKYTDEEYEKEFNKAVSLCINFTIKPERYRRRKSTVENWISSDKEKQNRFDITSPPRDVLCKKCSSQTKVIMKDLFGTNNEKVLFMLECVKCGKRRAVFEDGKEWKREAEKCPKCGNLLIEKTKRSKHTLRTKRKCTKCSYHDEELDDFRKSESEQRQRDNKNKELLSKYRKDFCLDDTNGPDYLISMDQLKAIFMEHEERKKKESDPTYQKAQKLKKLTINEVEKRIEDVLESKDYKNLRLGKPEIDKHVIVDFTVNDSKEGREEYQSRTTLKKLITEALKDTNWRLMSEGIQYRLGILSGRLKAYEREEDLVKLVE